MYIYIYFTEKGEVIEKNLKNIKRNATLRLMIVVQGTNIINKKYLIHEIIGINVLSF